MLSEWEVEKINEWLGRFEQAVVDLDRIATKQASAAESMCEAANSVRSSVDDFGQFGENLQGVLAQDRRRGRRTGD